MSEHRCFMGYHPGEDKDGEERYYVIVMQEMTIWGHTIDEATKRDYPEDWPHTLAARKRGYEFACYHSTVVPDGEIGSNPSEGLREITREEFIEAWDNGWPELADSPITQPGPVASVGFIDEKGNLVKVWDSIIWDSISGDAA